MRWFTRSILSVVLALVATVGGKRVVKATCKNTVLESCCTSNSWSTLAACFSSWWFWAFLPICSTSLETLHLSCSLKILYWSSLLETSVALSKLATLVLSVRRLSLEQLLLMKIQLQPSISIAHTVSLILSTLSVVLPQTNCSPAVTILAKTIKPISSLSGILKLVTMPN